MLHPHTALQFIDSTIGYGVVATRLIPQGTITWALDPLDQVWPPTRLARLPPPLQEPFETYSFRTAQGDSVLCWDHARFVNHSCRANCLETGFDCEIAVRDIAAGEQLTDDYATLYLQQGFTCRCGEPACRGHVSHWAALVETALASLGHVEQPLQPLVRGWAELELRACQASTVRLT